MAQYAGYGSHLHPSPTFSFTTTTPTTTFSPSYSIFPSLSSPPSISILRSSPSSIPLNHEERRLQNDDHISFLHLQPICSEDHFDRVIADAQLQQHSLLVVWFANWCRKCIYLKPKLEKLAVDYYPRLQFYSVDVNAVSHKVIARAGVTKMPTIQVSTIVYYLMRRDPLTPRLWKDSKKRAEVIGGNKAYLVINEVQEMIENDCTM